MTAPRLLVWNDALQRGGDVPKERILVVDDDPSLREVVRFSLEQAGFEPVEAKNGKEALEMFRAREPDLIVLDIMMPEMDGNEVCKAIRQTSSVPIIFLSSRDDEIDRVLGLELGGDDYVTKPFSPRELVARIKAVFRRTTATPEVELPDEALGHGELKLDLVRFKAYWGNAEVDLTKTEFAILKRLIGYPGKVFSRGELMMDGIVSDRTIDSHVRHVRKKFDEVGGELIETVHGIGYKLGDCT